MTGVVPFVVRRLLAGLVVIIVVTAATFWLGRYAPGDPILVRTGGRASPAAIARIRHELHLDQPIAEQYARYMWNLLHGDLGESLRHPGVEISTLIFPKLKVSLEEDIYPFFLTLLLGLPLGIYLALKRGTWQDPAITALLLVLI